MTNFKKLILTTLTIIFSHSTYSQTLIKGIVMEQTDNGNAPLPFANVYIEGTTNGVTTQLDGSYFIKVIETGNKSLSFSFLGLQKVTKEINVTGEGEINIDVVLVPDGKTLGEIKITGRAQRENEQVLLLERQKASIAMETIGAKELANIGVSDAGAAATKVSGITKQEGVKTLNVRGLGDRYNSTTLNGLPLPSNNAETKNIDLGIFSSDIIEYIGIEKVFHTSIGGDFAGANINIISKKHSGSNYFKVGVKSGSNSEYLNTDEFYLQDGPSFWGFESAIKPASLNNYTYNNKWNPMPEQLSPNLGFSIDAGHTYKVGKNDLNLFFTASFDNNYQYSNLSERRINGSDFVRKDLKGEQFSYETQSGAMLNLNFSSGANDYYFNSLMLNSSNQDLKNLRGFIFDLAEDGALVRRSEFEQTFVLVNQLLGIHKLNNRSEINWGIAFNRVNNLLPDRRHITLDGVDSNIKHFTDNDASNTYRYFHELVDNECAVNFSYDYKIGNPNSEKANSGKLSFGYSGKYKQRNFSAFQFNHDIYVDRQFPNYFVDVDVNDIDAFLNKQNLQKNEFRMVTFFGNFLRPMTYDGIQLVNGAFASAEYRPASKLLLLAGLRFEDIYQKIAFKTALKPEGGSQSFNEIGLLPSLSMKYSLNSKSNLRLAFGSTYTLPQFTEKALFSFEGITETTMGNPYLYPSKIYNVDLKYELFPNSGELISIAAFGKYILDPINKFVMASASNDFTYANTGDFGYVYGIEAELRKDILKTGNLRHGSNLNISGNISLMNSRQELDGRKILKETKGLITANFDNDFEVLQGAAPLIANASLSNRIHWNGGKSSITSTLVYNYVSDRLYGIGFSSLGNQVDKAVNTLDFIVRSSFRKFSLNLSAKNLLNEDKVRVQENESQDFVIKRYKNGITFSIGVNYKF